MSPGIEPKISCLGSNKRSKLYISPTGNVNANLLILFLQEKIVQNFVGVFIILVAYLQKLSDMRAVINVTHFTFVSMFSWI